MVNAIRHLVKLELVFIVSIIITLFFTDSYLPLELQEYLSMDAEATPTTAELISLILLLVVILINLVSMLGLLGIKLWARKTYIYSTLLIFPLCIFTGPYVSHAIGYTLDQITVLIQGMILSLLIYNNEYQETALNKSNKLLKN